MPTPPPSSRPRSERHSKTDFLLYTDGSGHTDGYGGSAALAYTAENTSLIFRHVLASYHTDVDRAELDALLLGLHGIYRYACDVQARSRKDLLEQDPLRIDWFCDRESLICSVAKDPQGRPLYARRSAPDLWMRFAWYEPMFVIRAHQIARDKDPNHILCDHFASDARKLMKDYLELPEFTPTALTTDKARASAEGRLANL